MTIETKYSISNKVVVEVEGSYRYGKVIGYFIMCTSSTDLEQIIRYEVEVAESIMQLDGSELKLPPRTVIAFENRIAHYLERLKEHRAKTPDATPATLLWNMKAEDNAPQLETEKNNTTST
jgi:hypothetical protein